ncbi:hypothetical protein B0H16DRAFT_1453337 [Mycena metata]|uniref:Uncharacterized protein n=1 Tax=Mycena metata TaxID=1033252 RepID=A0AAD7NM96_9AGAR|nr:hypothetical protein B0H16DRAFT_1453337 [Mycena metata]
MSRQSNPSRSIIPPSPLPALICLPVLGLSGIRVPRDLRSLLACATTWDDGEFGRRGGVWMRTHAGLGELEKPGTAVSNIEPTIFCADATVTSSASPSPIPSLPQAAACGFERQSRHPAWMWMSSEGVNAISCLNGVKTTYLSSAHRNQHSKSIPDTEHNDRSTVYQQSPALRHQHASIPTLPGPGHRPFHSYPQHDKAVSVWNLALDDFHVDNSNYRSEDTEFGQQIFQ